MNISRHILNNLTDWKNNPGRKPLILRGARQVGKTTLVHQFALSYKNSILLNLELSEDRRYFTDYNHVRNVLEALFISHNISPEEKQDTLIFIDEIQESPEAISMLRYFYEYEPDIHIIAAGSLLEHAMRKVKSFPVGRVSMLYMSPINFQEFLSATGKDKVLEQIHFVPIRDVAHKTLLDLFNRYTIIGGMPEVVRKYAETQNIADLPPIYESIWETYKEDVVKYSSSPTEARIIRHIMSTAPYALDARIKFQNFGNSNYRSREVGEAFRNLDEAKVIQLIYPTTTTTVPILPDLKKSPRLQFLDTGLINHELNLQSDMLALEDLSNTYRGSIIPHIITQEIISLSKTKKGKHTFWVREKTQSSAEVDIVVQFNNLVIPIEVKSGKEGKLKSLHQFIEEAPHPYAVRMYAGKFSIEEHSTRSGKQYFLMNLPYYLATKLFDYLEYFVLKHQRD